MINIFIADDHVMVREGLKSILSDAKDISILGEASEGNETLSKLRKCDVDILLLDIAMPGLSFLDIIKRIVDRQKTSRVIKILVLTSHAEDQFAIRAFKAGADGYLTKRHSPEELIKAIRVLNSGGKYISQTMTDKFVTMIPTMDNDTSSMHQKLSDREYQVFCKLGVGTSIKEIAEELMLSSKTISSHRSRILNKMNMKTNADIINYVTEFNLN